MKRSKKYTEAAKAIDRATLYDVNEAISLAKKAAVAKFDETIEVHILSLIHIFIAWTGRWGKRDALFYQIVYRYVKVIG